MPAEKELPIGCPTSIWQDRLWDSRHVLARAVLVSDDEGGGMARGIDAARGHGSAAGGVDTHSGVAAARLEELASPRLKASHLLLLSLLACAPANEAFAAESGFSSYGLGTSAFSAGVTPPPGTYVSAGLAAIRGDINGALTFGGIEIDVAMEIRKFISGSANLLYVPKETFLGG